MKLLRILLLILEEWRSVFPQERSAQRARRQAIASLCSVGRRTLSRAVVLLGPGDWSAEYRLHSRCSWQEEDLFQPIVDKASPFISEPVVAVAIDDTKLRKTGKNIRSASWQRDPMSPPFHVNFIWGLRFLQASILLPLYKTQDSPPRALPIRFTEVPTLKRPKKRASPEEWQTYRKLQKQQNLSTAFVEQLAGIRSSLDKTDLASKSLLAVVDGSFCNRICMRADMARTEIIGRTRKNAKLCFPAPQGSRKVYGEQKFTPEQIRQDLSIPWMTGNLYHGNRWRTVRYKEIRKVLWQGGTRRKPVRLLVVAPTPYRLTQTGRVYYRDPAYLLTTDLQTDAEFLLQKYFDRWQIEVNHREEKDTLGIGQAQLRSAKAVPRQPAFMVAAYSALHLAGLLAFGTARTNDYSPLPPWRKNARRPSCLDLITLLRKEIAQSSTSLPAHVPKIDDKSMVQFAAA